MSVKHWFDADSLVRRLREHARGHESQGCSCWVRGRPEIERYCIRWGAHNPACAQYRISQDPVDAENDMELRVRMERGKYEADCRAAYNAAPAHAGFTVEVVDAMPYLERVDEGCGCGRGCPWCEVVDSVMEQIQENLSNE